MLTDNEIKEIKNLSKENRQNIVKMVYNAQSGHIGGALSSADIMTVLFHKCMKTCPKWHNDKDFENRDRFVLSKGHASPAFYAILANCGYFDKNLLSTFRKINSFIFTFYGWRISSTKGILFCS